MDSKKRIALVTGASGGIGFELAKLLAKDNHDLILVDIREDQLLSSAAELKAMAENCQIFTIVQDLAKADAAQRLFDKVNKDGFRVDILVNNAGFGTFGLFSETDWERENNMLHVHVLTLSHLTKIFLPDMINNGWGKVMNVGSVAGFQPSPLMAVYNASKAYVLSFSEAIANELEGTGVTMTVLCPGLTKTGFQATVGVGKPELTSNSIISATAEEVAQIGYRAMIKGKVVCVPGKLNYILANLNRFLPRNTVTRMVRRVQERNRTFAKK